MPFPNPGRVMGEQLMGGVGVGAAGERESQIKEREDSGGGMRRRREDEEEKEKR